MNREGQKGGGVGFYARDYFNVKIIAHSQGKIPEFVIAELIHFHNKILLAVVYRRPNAAYPSHFFGCLAPLLPIYTNVVVTGDFNANMCTQNPASANLQGLIDSHSLYLVPSEPTHHVHWIDRPASHTWLDLFITKEADSVLELKK